MNEDFGFISINRKKFADKIAGIFSNSKSKENKDFYVLSSDSFKAMTFLNPKRKEIIKSISDEDFKIEVKHTIFGLRISKALSLENALIISKFLEEI
ncbi:hypothetical protein [Chryseobacterium sp. Marseille-Q3244]|uniref:hypothetical protein n=1 Tax=Chryseobacterium sp. Marseille-Q3244 TaxID=2758092 RepID=UPI002023F79D|nr:hypothetical protein [Chryseobacterium sp. Marseille-Q3244]